MADYAAIEKGAPGQQLMSDLESTQSGSESGSESEVGSTTTQSLEPFFRNKNAILVKQTPRGWIQECLGCEAKSEYKISSMDFNYFRSPGILREGAMTQPDELYALEQSSCCMRFLWRDGRAMNMQVSQGAEAGGAPIIEYEKPCGFPLECNCCDKITFPCCCLLPELKSYVDGHEIKSRYVCDAYCCVSKFAYLEDDMEVYRLKPSTCCGGCLPVCRCPFGKPMIPYFFYDVNGVRITDGQSDESLQPQIRKVWAGLKKECCTTADTFAIFFPKGIDSKRKAGLLGLTFLLDFTVFERQGSNSA